MKRWWWRLSRYGRPYWRTLTIVVLFMLTGVAMEALRPWPLKLIVDNVLTGEPLPNTIAWLTLLPGADTQAGLLAWLALATVFVFLASRSADLASGYLQTGAGNRMAYDLGADLLDHLQRLSLSHTNKRSTGDLVRRVATDSRAVRDLVVGTFLPVSTAIASLVFMFFIMWQIDRALTLLAAAVAVPMVFVIQVFIRPMSNRLYQQQQLEGEIMTTAERVFTALPVVQIFDRSDVEDAQFRIVTDQSLAATMRSTRIQVSFTTSIGALTALGTAGIMVFGGFQVLGGTFSVGSLLVFLSYLASLYAPLETLAYLSSGYASAAAGARRVFEVLDEGERVNEAPNAVALPSPSHNDRSRHVRLEQVTFGYEPGHPVLQDVSLEVAPGETVALVGATGTGKTTLVSMILRFYDPWSGRILVNGWDVRELSIASLRSQIAIVLQDPFLLPLSVAENIAYGRHEAARDEIEAAAMAANADEFIRQLPNGYDTVIGERGLTLSGGQRQRLAIARALLKDAPILILDEPTAALDAETETLVMEAIGRLIQGRTTFIIAHRLSTIRNADRIVVLDQGRVVEQGSHAELMASSGRYRRFNDTQLDLASK